MGDQDFLAREFDAHRAYLHAVSYRMLGSYAEAEDAVQDAWLRVSRSGVEGVNNLGGWLTTVVARVCLNHLRARNAKREDVLEDAMPLRHRDFAPGPEEEAELADSVGLALLVVLDTLSPTERLVFVLHDMFGVRLMSSPRWWTDHPSPLDSSPVARGDESKVSRPSRALNWRGNAPSSTPSSPRHDMATSTPFSKSLIPTLSFTSIAHSSRQASRSRSVARRPLPLTLWRMQVEHALLV